MKRSGIFLIAICALGYTMSFAGAGESAGLTLLEPVSARSAGLAEAGCSLSGDVVSIHYNPAGISGIENQAASVMYKRGLDEDTYASLIYARGFPFGNLGAAVLYYDTGEIELFDTGGNPVTEVGQRDIVFAVSFAKVLSGIPVGINLKLVSSEVFGENATAVAVDLGGQYGELAENLNIGLAVRNLGTELKYIDEGDPLPLNVCAGASYGISVKGGKLKALLDLPYYVNEAEILSLLGIQYEYKELITARLGYAINISDSDSEAEPLNIGLGFKLDKYSIDYAIGITRDLDNPHYISLEACF